MAYKIPDKSFTVNPQGSLPTIRFESNLSSTHFHVQVQTGEAEWSLVLNATGLGKDVPIQGGPIGSAVDFPNKRFFWDITLADQDGAKPVEAVLRVLIKQDGNELLRVDDDHFITGQETYYEFLDAK